MSTNNDQPSTSCMKRKNTDLDQRHEESKHIAVDRSSSPVLEQVEESHEESSEEDSAAKLGDYLSAQYEVLLRVLSNLSAFDLRRAAQVSKSWHLAARVVRDSRVQFHWLFWRANNGGWNVPPPLALYSSICEHVFSQPTICIAFFTKTAIKSFKCSSPDIICPVRREYKACGKLHSMESYMSLALGPKCEIMSFSVNGIIGSSQDLQTTFEVEHIKGGVQSMSAALFPNCRGVKIFKFKLSKQELNSLHKETDLAGRLGLPNEDLIQAVIMCAGDRVRPSPLALLVAHLQARQEHQFAVAGGVIEKGDSVEGLVILGDDVCAASLVIPDSVTEKDAAFDYVTRVKNCNLPSERAFCFMFSCFCRGQMWYLGDKDVESSLVNKVFPNTPIIGFFGKGELGLNYLPNFPDQNSNVFWQNWKTICGEAKKSLLAPPKVAKKSSDISVDHTYSTCLLYLSFNTANLSLPL